MWKSRLQNWWSPIFQIAFQAKQATNIGKLAMGRWANFAFFRCLCGFLFIQLVMFEQKSLGGKRIFASVGLTWHSHRRTKKEIKKNLTFNVTLDVCCTAEIAMRTRASNLCYVWGFLLSLVFSCVFFLIRVRLLSVRFVLYQNGFIRWNSIIWKDFIIFISLAVVNPLLQQ